MEVNRIYNENALTTLQRMPDGFLDCVVTSPPYYGLRSYGTEPQVWGNHNGCDHSFTESETKLLSENRNGKSSQTLEGGSGEYRQALHGHTAGVSGFCVNCNAWRGELGLEPTFDCQRDRNNEIEIREDLSAQEREELIRELLALGIVR